MAASSSGSTIPQYIIDVDRAKVADLGLNQADVMKNVVAALNSSIQFNKKNFWIDPVSHNQYFVGVQYFEEDIDSIETLLDVPITSPTQNRPIPLRNIATLRRADRPDRDHAHQSAVDDRPDDGRLRAATSATSPTTSRRVVDRFGEPQPDGVWLPYDPADHSPRP